MHFTIYSSGDDGIFYDTCKTTQFMTQESNRYDCVYYEANALSGYVNSTGFRVPNTGIGMFPNSDEVALWYAYE